MEFINKFLFVFMIICVHLRNAVALDNFFDHSSPRPELFELTDFNVPDIKITLNDKDFQLLFYSFECEKDTNPNYLKRNEKCYTAPWVNLNSALTIALNKAYIDRNRLTQTDLALISNVATFNDATQQYEEIPNSVYTLSLPEFEQLVQAGSDLKLEEIFSQPYAIAPIPSGMYFETEEASLAFELDNTVTEKSKVKFSVGGRSTKFFAKVGYNINIKDGNLFGVKQLRLRSVAVDPSFLRDKLAYDLTRAIGLPTLSENFARLYINDNFMGLYAMRDAYKTKWVEYTFGEKNSTHLYTCSDAFGDNAFFRCVNDEEEINDQDPDWNAFLDKLATVNTREQLEEFFDVKSYIKTQVSRYLFGSLDHISGTNNNDMYRIHDDLTGKDQWIQLLYDFDMNFGNFQTPDTHRSFEEDVPEQSNPMYQLLNLNSQNPEVVSVMDEIMRTVFNPNVLIDRIDKLKAFIDPYVKEDRTPDANGNLPGRFPLTIERPEELATYEDFLGNTEFTTIKANQHFNNFNDHTNLQTALGLKQWVIERFKYACEYYNLDCSYADEILSSPAYSNYKIEEVQHDLTNEGCNGTGYACCIFSDTTLASQDPSGDWGKEGDKFCLFENGYQAPKDAVAVEANANGQCWSLAKGFPCCEMTKEVTFNDEANGEIWGIENGTWCGML
jgi:spore coat protein CotH